MRNKIKKLRDPNISKNEEDQILDEFIKNEYDQILKNKWKNVLNKEYKVTRKRSSLKKKLITLHPIKIIVASAACISLVILLQLFNFSSLNSYELAQHYLTTQEILHPGAPKGTFDESQDRILAIQAFNNKNYELSHSYYQKIESLTAEDLYYHGLALLLNDQYQEAIRKFEEQTKKHNSFKQEINWYLSLAYILNRENEKATSLLKQINTSDWNHQEAQKLLSQLNKE
ncbi:hypothetical protein D1816_04510 [Aquimarina sp. AD10]|uniref:tetratricopeptide repeat protein n=1 Tax=Aquimarina sp. AD10 TaxID=1714849 RepID=UPI000E4A6FEB|nr:hypothetical protein [Aquimarina sp. AD10]AXT59647.1 hypothetical protein D1816_04510 [Aquimarina sp. AD10]RKM97523.1 hypothetical protein D7033_14090 [Aquimarina sp. AD10]